MKIPAGEYKVEEPVGIYKMGETPKPNRKYNYWISFKNGKEITIETHENKISEITFEMDLEIDPETKTIRFIKP